MGQKGLKWRTWRDWCILKQLTIREYQLRPSPLECGMCVNFFCLQKREAWALGIRKKAEGTQGYWGGIDAWGFCMFLFSCCFFLKIFSFDYMYVHWLHVYSTPVPLLCPFPGASRRQEKQRWRALTRQVWSHRPGLGHGCGFGFWRFL